MLISVIVVSYNSGPLLTECIRAVLASTVPVEVIVSDNGSSDCSLSAVVELAETDPRLKLIRNGGNLGFAAANNRALGQTNGTHVLFLNPDCLVATDTLERVVVALMARPRAGMAGCLIANPDGSEQEGCRRREPTPGRLLAKAFGVRHLLPADSMPGDSAGHREPLPTETHAVEAISGAFMLIRREALESVGSFDEAYFMHWEDLDLCLRFRRAGYEILFVPGAHSLHFKGRSSQRKPVRVEWHKHVGMALFLRKFYFSRWPSPLFALITFPIWLRFGLKVLLPAQSSVSALAAKDNGERDADEVWVFGATSAVGHCLLPRLIAKGYRVRAFSRNPAAHGVDGGVQLRWEVADISDALLVHAGGRPRIAIHLAPLDLLPGQIDSLIQAGMQRLIAFGSTSVFTKRGGTQAEQSLMERLTTAERAIETRCAEAGVRWSIFRPTIIYCPGLDRSLTLLTRFIRHMRFFPVVGCADGLRQPVHADDLAKACISLLASEAGWNRSYNLSGGETLGYREMLTRIFGRQGRRPRIVRVPEGLFRFALVFARLLPAYRSLNIEMVRRVNIDMNFDHSSASEAFGYDPRPFQP